MTHEKYFVATNSSRKSSSFENVFRACWHTPGPSSCEFLERHRVFISTLKYFHCCLPKHSPINFTLNVEDSWIPTLPRFLSRSSVTQLLWEVFHSYEFNKKVVQLWKCYLCTSSSFEHWAVFETTSGRKRSSNVRYFCFNTSRLAQHNVQENR